MSNINIENLASNDIDYINDFINHSILLNANDMNLGHKNKNKCRTGISKPWFDDDCKLCKKNLKKTFN